MYEVLGSITSTLGEKDENEKGKGREGEREERRRGKEEGGREGWKERQREEGRKKNTTENNSIKSEINFVASWPGAVSLMWVCFAPDH